MLNDVVSNPPTEQSTSVEQDNALKAPTDLEFLERFNRLASKESSMRKQSQEMRSREESYKAKVERLERLEKLAQENPDDLLSEFGLDYNKLTERRLSGLGGEQEKLFNQMSNRLEELEKKLSLQSKLEQEAKSTQAMQNAQSEVRRICEADDFELVRANEAYDLVLDVAAEVFARGKHISLQDAAKYVEKNLEEKLERILAAKKVASRIAPKKETEAQQNEEQSEKTVTHNNVSLGSSSFNASSKPTPTALNEDDLRAAFWRAYNSGK